MTRPTLRALCGWALVAVGLVGYVAIRAIVAIDDARLARACRRRG